MQGRLIVFEGTNGSDKFTQFRMLCEWMEREGRPFRRLVSPQYQEPSSALLKMYLNGEFGSHLSDVNPYVASTLYAVDRYASWKKVWGDYYRGGGLVFSDRYIISNAVCQADKLPEAEWEGFFRQLSDFERGKLGLPLPDLVVYLDMPIEQAMHLLHSREAPTYTKGDIHEVDTDYPAPCRETTLQAVDCPGWAKIPCVDGAGTLHFTEGTRHDIQAVAVRILG